MWDYFYFQDEQQCIWQHALNSCYSCGVSSSFSYALVSASTSQYGIPKSSGTTKRSWKDYKSRTSREGIHYLWICGKKLVSIHIIILIFVSDCKCVLLSVCCNTSICYSNILLSLFCVSFQNSWWAFKSEKKKMTREKVGPLHIATLIYFFIFFRWFDLGWVWTTYGEPCSFLPHSYHLWRFNYDYAICQTIHTCSGLSQTGDQTKLIGKFIDSNCAA